MDCLDEQPRHVQYVAATAARWTRATIRRCESAICVADGNVRELTERVGGAADTRGELHGGTGTACGGVYGRAGRTVARPMGGRWGGGVFWGVRGRVDVGIGRTVERKSKGGREVEAGVGR